MIFFGNAEDLWLITIAPGCAEGFGYDGLVYSDGTTWQRFTAENSGLSSDGIYDLSVDSAGNAWLATDSGLQMVPRP